jgi:hypothetical protein
VVGFLFVQASLLGLGEAGCHPEQQERAHRWAGADVDDGVGLLYHEGQTWQKSRPLLRASHHKKGVLL